MGTIFKSIYALKAHSMNQTGRTCKIQRNTLIKYAVYNRSEDSIPPCLFFKPNRSSTTKLVQRHVTHAFPPFMIKEVNNLPFLSISDHSPYSIFHIW